MAEGVGRYRKQHSTNWFSKNFHASEKVYQRIVLGARTFDHEPGDTRIWASAHCSL